MGKASVPLFDDEKRALISWSACMISMMKADVEVDRQECLDSTPNLMISGPAVSAFTSVRIYLTV
jgi:hypothetical protein